MARPKVCEVLSTMVRRPVQPSLGEEFDTAPTHRLFFAVPPDAEATNSSTQLISKLRQDRFVLGRPVDADRRHVTLIFLGNFVGQTPPRLIAAAQAAAATVRARPFEMTFDYVAGGATGLRLLASIEPPALGGLLRTLCEALIMAGVNRRHVNPTSGPHVTLSYGGDAVPRTRVEPIAWTVREFVLIESLLGTHQHLERGRWSMQP